MDHSTHGIEASQDNDDQEGKVALSSLQLAASSEQLAVSSEQVASSSSAPIERRERREERREHREVNKGFGHSRGGMVKKGFGPSRGGMVQKGFGPSTRADMVIHEFGPSRAESREQREERRYNI